MRGRYGRQESAINPGRFNRALTLRPSSGSQGSGGDFQPAWSSSPDTGVSVRGYWRQTTQRELIVEGGKFSTATGVWEIPWVPSIDENYRVEYGTRKYRIIGILNPEERNRELHLFVAEDEGARGTEA